MDNIYFKPYKIFHVDGKIFIFNIDSTAIYQIDERTLKVIQQSGKTKADIYQEVSNQFTKKDFDELIEKWMSLILLIKEKNL